MIMDAKQQILELIERDSTLTTAEIAAMLCIPEEQVRTTIAQMEEDRTIVAYRAVVNWSKTDRPMVTALIELKVSPQRGHGFEKIAERISKYPEVRNVFLMSGSFDIAAFVEGKDITSIAEFVWEKLAIMEGVVSTATHFVLKKYKEDGVELLPEPVDERGFNLI